LRLFFMANGSSWGKRGVDNDGLIGRPIPLH
jgi:hypothetical protein